MSNPNEEEPLSRAARAAEDLYHLRDTYFPPNPDDRISKLQHESDLALKLLDSIPPEQRKSPMQRATFEYLRGKMLDVFSDYRKEAEDHLSKAVKLNPSLADAWLCLGNCIWKKGDLTAAKNCLSLALDKGPNKKILCQLSMLKRKMSQGAENQAELVEESIQHAKEAITLDVKDGNSWYNLGNACLTSFFVTGAWDHAKLLHSLKAYQNAVNKYLENYQRALSGFEAAALKDPGLNAAEEVQKIVNLLDKVDNLLKGHVRAKRMASLASSRVTIDLLSEGPNRALAVEGKVFFFVRSESVAPLYYLLCDSNQSCFVLSVYGVRTDVIKEGDQLTLLDPYFRDVNLSWKEKRYQFKTIRLDFYEQVLVNGKALTPQQAVRTSIYAQHKP
ncbi:Tetratricopeptide repeat protein 5 [Mucuna pruriens]|uniref:Tetratricopeptide repeat protein 5 n=1 Tax=Mucuna pruriens TaxID=157652 RepID=A0A371HFU4_MUCPR|nr:Tetratricopeptide repeat protein 5 [Mucuna pruriens]